MVRNKIVRVTDRARLVTVAAVVLLSVSAGFVGGWFGSQSRSQRDTTNPVTQREVVASQSNLISSIAKNLGPSVVSVNVAGQIAQPSIFGDGLSGGGQATQSAGTGFIVSSDGVIVTNRHVVPAGTTRVSVVLADGTELDNVQVLGRTGDSDPLDIAFLKITDTKGQKLTPVTLGDSSQMQIGDMVVAIGNALGQFQNTVTSGIISGHGREVQAGDANGIGATENLQDLFQTDAAINEGNSGGPLVNASGQVIGINTAIAGGAQNIGFSIPINDVSALIKGVLTTGKLQRPYLGVRYVSVTNDVAAQYHLSVKNGAYILPSADASSVMADSPAAKAGLKEGDVITKVNEVTLDQNNSLSTVLGRYAVGQQVSLTLIRDGKTQTLNATLQAAPTS